jgi:hypothetical protein
MTATVEIGQWLASHFWWVPAAILFHYVITIVGDRFSERSRARSDQRLRGKVQVAASRLPQGIRGAYEQEWLGELDHILHGQHARPVVRLWHGLRYARGLRRAARDIARSHEGSRTVPQRLGRIAAKSASNAAIVVLVPPATIVFFALVAVVAALMLAVAAWAALAAPYHKIVTGRGLGTAYRRTFLAGCRTLGLSLFGWPIPDPPGERTLLAWGKTWTR